jgi:hypothetical protein
MGEHPGFIKGKQPSSVIKLFLEEKLLVFVLVLRIAYIISR